MKHLYLLKCLDLGPIMPPVLKERFLIRLYLCPAKLHFFQYDL